MIQAPGDKNGLIICHNFTNLLIFLILLLHRWHWEPTYYNCHMDGLPTLPMHQYTGLFYCDFCCNNVAKYGNVNAPLVKITTIISNMIQATW
jgi:hypothetical protein